MRRNHRGFTLIELIVVMAIVSLLLTLAAPRYFRSIDRSKETILKANLDATRDALDKFHADTGRYPEQLDELVSRHYLRSLPWDPIAESAESWVIVPPADGNAGAVYSISSSATGTGTDGSSYAQW
ncbi:type II secretion system protein [Actimicrobium sp. CCI2.3]|uniref:type II secretion system protein n=1 Tax=Actimicrobium sp. CCI2.3 TaxID=3048616 RepID=UPI002AB4B607|nr:prepilin-type N-terminal cleavage/methylation domain-containing protein [Actimicrobium sp. CCI2.3]MDY7574600.1 prepilin-type N-terminal cleavage/methylation domain-containing protein [Actimicrobium sp. CCI2.3]MEB0023901.1 prepilin-type N-terminal cleavage/methylation domain-containing protein [Actimicrobium sp. CCI2.3]